MGMMTRPSLDLVKLTGRIRRHHSSGAIVGRSTKTSREYKCQCGHTGWSNHVDLERLSQDRRQANIDKINAYYEEQRA